MNAHPSKHVFRFALLLTAPLCATGAGFAVRTETLASVPTNIAKEIVADNGRHVLWIDRTPQHGCVYLDGRADPVAVIGGGPVVSPDGKHLAYKVAIEDGKKRATVLDGKAGPTFDQVLNDSIAFTPDNRLLYTAQRGNHTVGMLGDQAIVDTAQARSGPVYSPDFKHVAIKVVSSSDPTRRAVLIDGHQGPAFDQIMEPYVFSSDSTHLAYIGQNGPGANAMRARSWIVTLDGTPGPTFNSVEALTFVPGGTQLVYVGHQAGKQCLVLDQRPGPAYDEVDPYFLKFSADGRHYGYRAQKGERWTLVMDGKEGATYEGILDWALSPDGVHYAIAMRNGGRWFVDVDGKELPAGDGIGLPLVFSADGRHLAWRRPSAGKWAVVKDGQPGESWDLIPSGPVFSPDGAHLAYVALKGGSCFVVVDGKTDGPFDWYAGAGVTFSAGGHRLAFAVQKSGLWHVVVDGQAGEAFDEVAAEPFRFSPDGKHLLGMVRQGAAWQVVVDGQHSPSFDRIPGSTPVFDADGSVVFLAIRDQTLFRVHMAPEN